MNEIAEEAFKPTNLAPAYAFVMLEIIKTPGLSHNELAIRMILKASTITRFVNKLLARNLVERVQKGRNSAVFPTKNGKDFKAIIEQVLKILHDTYCDILGNDIAIKITNHIQNINQNLKK